MTKLDKLEIMRNYFKDAVSELDYDTPFQLLIAVTLSAQTTDKAVNKVTKGLFNNYYDANSLKDADYEHVYDLISKIGLAKTKSKNIIKIAKIYDGEFNNEMPTTIEELTILPGVGNKTASVCLALIHNLPYMAVDTHIERITKRCSIVPESYSVDKIAITLQRLLKDKKMIDYHNSLIYFGRYHCKARNPYCLTNECKLQEVCRYYKKHVKKPLN